MLIRSCIGSARSGTANAYVTLPWTKRVQTVCFWHKPNQAGPYNVWDVDNGSTGWFQLFSNGGTLDVWCDNSPSQIYSQAGALPQGMWTWVAVIGNGASSFILWKRATDSAVTVAPMTEIGTNPITGMWLASDGFGGENGDGSYKHFKVWDRVFTPRELIRESLQGEPVSRRGLHTYLPMRSGQSDGSSWAVNKGSTLWTRGNTWLSDRSQPPVPDVLHRGRRAFLAVTAGGGGGGGAPIIERPTQPREEPAREELPQRRLRIPPASPVAASPPPSPRVRFVFEPVNVEELPQRRLEAPPASPVAPSLPPLVRPHPVPDATTAEERPQRRLPPWYLIVIPEAPPGGVWFISDEITAEEIPQRRARMLPPAAPAAPTPPPFPRVRFTFEGFAAEELPQRRLEGAPAAAPPPLVRLRALVEQVTIEEGPQRRLRVPGYFVEGTGTNGTGAATYSDWTAAGAASESTSGTCAAVYDAWSAAGSGSDAAILTGAAVYDAWGASGAGTESHSMAGGGFYDAWSARGFDVAPVANLTAWHQLFGPTLLQ